MEAIPKIEDPERYKELDISRSGFVKITSDERFDVKMQYPLLGMSAAETECFVRKEVYDMLVRASSMLPEGYRLRIWDAWRPFALQKELYEVYSDKIIEDFELDDCTSEQKKAVIRRFVSDPVSDRAIPPVHTTGGAIDLTILDETGCELLMGTGFDEFSDRTYTAYFEDTKDHEVRDNRRLLYHIMTESGFTNLPSEWWHYDFGDRFWAYYNERPAIYEGIFTREEIYE